MFIFSPALLFIGSLFDVIEVSITALLGTFALACGMQGWLIGRAIPFLLRIPLIAGALLLIKPGIYTDIAGIGLLIATYFVSRIWKKPLVSAG
jgi:TRAP-type uncharacterized transport system fused permease subunit